MKELVLDAIRSITKAKEAQGIAPTYTLKKELDRKLAETLSNCLTELYKEGLINVGETINDKYIEMK